MKIKDVLENSITRFKQNNLENPDLNARLLLAEVVGIKHLMLDLYREKELTHEQAYLYEEYCRRREHHEPIQHIIGYTEFYDSRILVNDKVLIPRPETEYLIESIKNKIRNKSSIKRIIDIGTGSGVIAISLKKIFPDAEVVAVDISEDALEIAKTNAELNDCEINFVHADIFTDALGCFNIIVSNPPYVTDDEYEVLPKEVKSFEPKLALVGEENGLVFYRKIIELSKKYLTENGFIFFEIGESQSLELSFLAQKNSYNNFETLKDLVGKDRIFIIQK